MTRRLDQEFSVSTWQACQIAAFEIGERSDRFAGLEVRSKKSCGGSKTIFQCDTGAEDGCHIDVIFRFDSLLNDFKLGGQQVKQRCDFCHTVAGAVWFAGPSYVDFAKERRFDFRIPNRCEH